MNNGCFINDAVTWCEYSPIDGIGGWIHCVTEVAGYTLYSAVLLVMTNCQSTSFRKQSATWLLKFPGGQMLKWRYVNLFDFYKDNQWLYKCIIVLISCAHCKGVSQDWEDWKMLSRAEINAASFCTGVNCCILVVKFFWSLWICKL